VQQPGCCCSKDVVDTDGFGPYQGIRIDASGGRVRGVRHGDLSRDPEIELVSASLLGGTARENAGYGTSFVAVRQGRKLLVQAQAVTPQTSRRLEEQRRQLRDAARVYRERHSRELEPLLVLACPGFCPVQLPATWYTVAAPGVWSKKPTQFVIRTGPGLAAPCRHPFAAGGRSTEMSVAAKSSPVHSTG
jgi:hypothetical protein